MDRCLLSAGAGRAFGMPPRDCAYAGDELVGPWRHEVVVCSRVQYGHAFVARDPLRGDDQECDPGNSLAYVAAEVCGCFRVATRVEIYCLRVACRVREAWEKVAVSAVARALESEGFGVNVYAVSSCGHAGCERSLSSCISGIGPEMAPSSSLFMLSRYVRPVRGATGELWCR